MPAPIVLKLGGSAITDKSRVCTPRLGLIQRVVDEIASYRGGLILLHGGGSYAHPFATKRRVENRFRARSQLPFVSEIELNLDQLTRIIGVALLQKGRAFVPLRPMSLLMLRNGRPGSSFLGPVRAALRVGLVPLIHGDLAFDEAGGCGIVSADSIASLVGEKLRVSRVLFGCDVDGVYHSDPKKSRETSPIPEVTSDNYSEVLRSMSIKRLDATGGMRGKVLEAVRLARRGTESFIFNLDPPTNLRTLLRGSSSVGTRFVSWK
jgi:isopentenyl phosphate kinase